MRAGQPLGARHPPGYLPYTEGRTASVTASCQCTYYGSGAGMAACRESPLPERDLDIWNTWHPPPAMSPPDIQ